MVGRSLRPRTSTPSYALRLDIGESDDEPGLDASSGEDDEQQQQRQQQQAGAASAAVMNDAEASISNSAATPRGRGRGASRARGTPQRGRGRGRGRGTTAAAAAASRRSGSSSGSDFAAGSAHGEPSTDDDDDDSSDAYSSTVDSLRAVSDEDDDDGNGFLGSESDLELAPSARRRRGGLGRPRASASTTLTPKPGVIKPKVRRKHAGGKALIGSRPTDDRKREDIWTFSEGNAPLVPHFTSYLTAPPSLRARSDVVHPPAESVPRRPMRIEEVTGRVRTFTASILGMTPWDAWAGEGWRPNPSAQDAGGGGGRPTTNGWASVEKAWKGLQLLSAEQAAPHLPASSDEPPLKLLAGHLTPSSPQTERTLPALSASSLASHGIRKKGAVFNPGGPVWSVDWCPMTEDESEKRDWKLYLAVAAHASLEADAQLGRRKPAETPGSIQIWSVGPTAELRARERREYRPKPNVKPEGLDGLKPKMGRPPKAKKATTPKRRGKQTKVATQAAMDEEVPSEAAAPAANGDTMPMSTPAPKSGVSATATATEDVLMAEEGTAAAEEEEEEGDLANEWELEASLAMVVCVEGGQPCRLQWCPGDSADSVRSTATASTVPKLGILAGTFEDGTVKLFAIPDPDAVRTSQDQLADGPLYVRLQPVTTLELDDSMLLSLDWGSDRILATGSSNGRLAIWDAKGAALSGDDDPLPLQLMQIHDSPIRSTCFVRAPQADATGQYRFDWEQHLVMTTGNNRLVLTDLRESEGIGLPLRIGRSSSYYASTASVQNGTAIVGDGDYQAYLYTMRPRGVGMMRRAAGHQGAIWDLSTSDYHPNLASASADGSLIVTNTLRGTTKNRASWVTLMENVYRIDKNSQTGELRMLDNLLPQSLNTQISLRNEAAVGATSSFSDKALEDLNARRASSQAWSPDVGVLSVAWNSSCGIGRAGLLASGTACGLARIDVMVDGQWRPGVGRTREGLRERLRAKEIFL